MDTIYKAFGGKSGIVRALWQRSLAGRRPVPAPVRSDALSSTETDPVRVLRGWGQFTSELAPEGAPVMLLIRAASATDPEMAAPGVTFGQASDTLWTYSSTEFYELLVLKSGWDVN